MKKILLVTFVLSILSVHSANAFTKSAVAVIFQDDSIIEGKIYNVKAEVKKKFREEKRMIIKHECIAGLMKAMTMAFSVADSTIFDSCAKGSKGVFTLQILKGYPVITEAHFVKQPRYICPMHHHELSNTPGSCSICGMPLEKRK